MRDDPLRRLRDTRRAEKRGESVPAPERPNRPLVSQGGRSLMPSVRKTRTPDDLIRSAVDAIRNRETWRRL
jgi:hypothetical protein